jgi:hypothetical protein
VYIFVNKYFSISVLVIMYNALLHNYKFGLAQCVGLLQRVYIKFTLHFLDIHSSFYKF